MSALTSSFPQGMIARPVLNLLKFRDTIAVFSIQLCMLLREVPIRSSLTLRSSIQLQHFSKL